jgi:uncharacterized membrane protein YphA (DoxX/SURF4 family)/thiol-disulfide isomerase/thioredoxin
MKTIFQNRWLIFTLRMALGLIFIAASISKIQDVPKFISIVTSYGILPDSLANLYGNIVPWVELFIGCALVLGVFIRISAAFLIPLIISFIIASSYALANSIGSSCGCFGKFLTLSYPVSLTIDIFMLVAVFILFFTKENKFLSIGQIVDKLHIKSTVLNVGSRLAIVGLVMALVAVGVVCIHNLLPQPEQISELVNIPAVLTADVDAALLQNKPVLMEFYVDGCHLCQAAAPVIYDMEKKFGDRTVFLRIDYRKYYQNPEVAKDLNIRNIPTVLIISNKNSNGQYMILCRFEGSVQRAALQGCLNRAINSQ